MCVCVTHRYVVLPTHTYLYVISKQSCSCSYILHKQAHVYLQSGIQTQTHTKRYTVEDVHAHMIALHLLTCLILCRLGLWNFYKIAYGLFFSLAVWLLACFKSPKGCTLFFFVWKRIQSSFRLSNFMCAYGWMPKCRLEACGYLSIFFILLFCAENAYLQLHACRQLSMSIQQYWLFISLFLFSFFFLFAWCN